MAFNLAAAVAQAKAKGPDMTETTTGGGQSTPPAGFVRLRFVGYYEVGKHESSWQGQKKVSDRAELVFELSGPKHPPIVTDNGTFPMRITERVKISLNEKSNFVKLFNAMNYENKATHIAELLGDAYVAEIEHNVVKIEGKDVTFANLKNVRRPFVVNPEKGDEYKINVDPPLTEIKVFLWDFATPEMWDAIFIEGEYEARKDKDGKEIAPAKSKNVIQNKIRTALNFKGLPIYDYASGAVKKDDAAALDAAVGGAEEPAREEAAAGADPLDGVA